MYLKELKDLFDNVPDDITLNYGLSGVFSWRGSYDEVAFSIDKNVTAKQCKELIRQAYEDTFLGYKGGVYEYHDCTEVHFEIGGSAYTDGGYTEEMIAQIKSEEPEYDRDMYLVKLLITNPV